MKKIILFFVMVLFVTALFSQVNSFKIDASKTYEDGKRTSYLTLSARIDVDDAIFVVEELESHSEIYKFSFYSPEDFSKCMFTSDLSIDEAMIVDMIYDVINIIKEENITDMEREFGNSSFLNGHYKVEFELDDIADAETLKAIYLTFKESDFVSDVNYNENSFFELFSTQPIKLKDIETLLVKWDMSISEDYIK